MSKIIVTGAAGFIGTNVVRSLNEQGIDDIVIVDELGSDEKWRNLTTLRYAEFLDLQDFRNLILHNEFSGEYDAVIHLGACSSTTETDADYLADNNYQYSRDLCLWCLDYGIRFVYASSAATYGNGSLGYSDDDSKTANYIPLNMYGYSKQMFDMWVLRNGFFDQIVGLKYFNVFGPFEGHKGDMRSVVHKAFHQIQETGKVSLFKSYKSEYEDGGQVRDFIYVKDAVDVTIDFALNNKNSGLFNCGTGSSRSWLDLANATFAAMGIKPNIDFIEMPEHLKGKYQYHTEADPAKLRAAGYDKPFTSLEDGIRDYVQNYLMEQK
ncbi:ADP-glyceromanno-heptose 6-epimerase [bacterium]|jgi:ADP-L-glycero-D-manno-heptose 6-epimerase|nr:ADP-glyceromanno-heptose 6-epimerase [bacterium]MBT4292070.1 ADP-glyceromanno-heptose 6-epimerase [bacterium]MBT7310190.1 ADP-glyceromanno-heptose 6-epimerase [bacterium]